MILFVANSFITCKVYEIIKNSILTGHSRSIKFNKFWGKPVNLPNKNDPW